MIREAYLLHHGRARVFSQDDSELALLTGDYLYAAGLVEICATGDVGAVADLAELISRCARNRGDETGDDEIAWTDCVARLGRRDSRRPAVSDRCDHQLVRPGAAALLVQEQHGLRQLDGVDLLAAAVVAGAAERSRRRRAEPRARPSASARWRRPG